MANKMLMKLNRFLFFQEPPPPPPWWSSSPSPSPSTNQEITVALNTVLERLRKWASPTIFQQDIMFFSPLKTQILAVLGSTKVTIITTLILGGGLFVVCMVFFPGPTLMLLYYLGLACFYLCLGIVGLLCLTCYYLFKGLCFTYSCLHYMLLSPLLSVTSRWLRLAVSATSRLFLQAMSWLLFPAQRIRPSWVSTVWVVTCRWASTLRLVTRRWLLLLCFWISVESVDRGEEGSAGPPEPSPANPVPENGPSGLGGGNEGGVRNESGTDPVLTDRQKMKESDEFKDAMLEELMESEEFRRAMLQEWIARQRDLERQAEEALTRRQPSKKTESERTEANYQTTPKPRTDRQTPSRRKRMIRNRAAIPEGESSNSKLVFCSICMESKPNLQIFQGLYKCNHVFCTDCMVQYIASKIKDKIVPVECPDPDCKWAIEPEDCGPVLPKELLGRWEMVLFEASISGFQKFYCPFKDCSVLMVDDGEEEVTQSECPHCRRMFCAKCHVGWHAGFTCREFQRLGKHERAWEDIMLMKLAKDNQWRRCSKCKYYVEKNEGCVHMTCRCGHEFCYRCGGQWSNTHAC